MKKRIGPKLLLALMIVFVMSTSQNVYAHTGGTEESGTENSTENSSDSGKENNTENSGVNTPVNEAETTETNSVKSEHEIIEDSSQNNIDTNIDKYASYKPYLIAVDILLFAITTVFIYKERKKARHNLAIEK